MNPNQYELKIKREIVRIGQEVYVVTTSDKIGKTSFASICPLSEVDAIITDKHLPEQKIKMVQKLGVKIIKESGDE